MWFDASISASIAAGSGAAAIASRTAGVSVGPGGGQLTRIPGPESTARLRVRASTAPFEALYAANAGCPCVPDTEHMLTIVPRPLASIAGIAALHASHV